MLPSVMSGTAFIGHHEWNLEAPDKLGVDSLFFDFLCSQVGMYLDKEASTW